VRLFISIKKYLDTRPEPVAAALLRMVQLLLQGLKLHAVKGGAIAVRREATAPGLHDRGVPDGANWAVFSVLGEGKRS